MFVRTLIVIVLLACASPALAQDEANAPNINWPGHREGDYVVHDYKFVSGESLPEVKLHYRTIGTAKKNAAGEAVNAVLLLQGNSGTGANWFRPTLADELFKPASRSTRRNTTSSSPTRWAVAAHRDRPTASRVTSRITAITIWST
jgi:hypothetical protein